MRRFDELAVSDATAALLPAMPSATIDRRLAPARAAMTLRGRSHTGLVSALAAAVALLHALAAASAILVGWASRAPAATASA